MIVKKLRSNLKLFNFVRCAVKRLALLGVIGGWLVSACWAAPGPGDATPKVVTSLAELSQLPMGDHSLAVSLRIEGTVWWSSKAEGRVILNDDTAVLQIELDLPCQMPVWGDRLILEGDCLALKAGDVVKLSGVPVVDHDGIHDLDEKSGTIYLKAGRQSIRVAWFDRIGSFGLDVSYEGPDLPRQKIPDAVLFRPQTDAASATTNYVNGLNYRCYEGQWWKRLPNFDHIAAAQTGIVGNFDIAVRSRDNHVGLYFAGFITVPKDGDYTFYVRSDDGSRLFIGDSSLRIHTLGHAALPSPLSVGMEETPPEAPEFQWSEIEGTVTSFHRCEGALEVELMTKTGLMKISIAEDSDRSYTLMPQNRIRVVGLSRRVRSVDRGWISNEFFVQQWEDVEQRYIAPQIWTEYPLVEIERLSTIARSRVVGSVVHLRGRVASQGAGQSMLLEDGSGRIVLDDAVPDTRVGQLSDVLGRVAQEGSNLVLRSTHFRQMGEGGAETNRLPVLTTAERVSQLSHEEAARGYPVRVRGVITSIMEYGGAVLQDASRGIYLNLWEKPIYLEIGDYCEVEGVTAPFGFQPDIQVTRLTQLGTSMLPNPVQPTWDQLINGSLQCNYVELEGVVTSIKDHTIALLTRDGRINIRLNPLGADIPRDSLGATVRLRGCLFLKWDKESRRVLVGNIKIDQQKMTVIKPAPVDPFAIPLKRIGDLLLFDSQGGALQRVKVSGVLVYKDAHISCLMNGESGLSFIPAKARGSRVGDRLEVVGFVDLSGPSPLLRDAVVRRLDQAALPKPRRLGTRALVRDEYDSTLVQLEGVLLGISERPDGTVFEMQSGRRRFMAMVGNPRGLDELPKLGSKLELTGVYVGQGGNRVLGQPIDSFWLLLNSGRDVRVISRPSWWTFRRLVSAVGLLIGVLLASLVWINLLHRKVEQRTQQLGDQIRQREIEQERTRVARNLHDDLGAGLTEVNMLASLVQSPTTSREEKARYVGELNELALQMVSSLDEIVWAINPRNDTVASLADYFGLYAQRLLELASVGCGLDVAEDLPDHALDPRFRQELFLAFKEALVNVVQHALATKVWVHISIQGDEMVVIVSDDGCGIIPARNGSGADGLANMRERMSALGGHCDIQSDPGKGTTVRLQAPMQKVIR